MKKTKQIIKEIDVVSVAVPFACIIILSLLFFIFPEQSNQITSVVRGFLGDQFCTYYVVLALAAFGVTMYMAFSKYGSIKLGDTEKPQYSNFAWAAMICTSSMGADVIFYSLAEWAMYGEDPRIEQLGGTQDWATTFPLFHWGPIGWALWIVVAIAFAFMLHVRGTSKQKFSEACRPLLKGKVDGIWGKVIDIFTIFAVLAGCATTFAVSTPFLTMAIAKMFGIGYSVSLSIAVLILIGLLYTITVWNGMKGISIVAKVCVYGFVAMLLYVLIFGGEATYIIETGIQSLGNMLQNFIGLSTYMDPLRENSFPQNWTIFYWAYWLSWAVQAPMFIATISKGRTIKQTVLGTYFWGCVGIMASFIVLGNYGLAQQMKHGMDITGYVAGTGDINGAMFQIINTLPLPMVALALVAFNMITFYMTTFDAITVVMSNYSYKKLEGEKESSKGVRVFWSIMLILLPIALMFSESSMSNMQSMAIIAALPLGIIIILVIVSFFKDAKRFIHTEEKKNG